MFSVVYKNDEFEPEDIYSVYVGAPEKGVFVPGNCLLPGGSMSVCVSIV